MKVEQDKQLVEARKHVEAAKAIVSNLLYDLNKAPAEDDVEDAVSALEEVDGNLDEAMNGFDDVP